MIVRDIFAFLRSWWRVDRIRACPSEGQWLRVATGDLIEHQGITFEVQERLVQTMPGKSLVAYRCVAGPRMMRLLVTPGHSTMICEENNVKQTVHPDQLAHWPITTTRASEPAEVLQPPDHP
jgi:hypothetical protein